MNGRGKNKSHPISGDNIFLCQLRPQHTVFTYRHWNDYPKINSEENNSNINAAGKSGKAARLQVYIPAR